MYHAAFRSFGGMQSAALQLPRRAAAAPVRPLSLLGGLQRLPAAAAAAGRRAAAPRRHYAAGKAGADLQAKANAAKDDIMKKLGGLAGGKGVVAAGAQVSAARESILKTAGLGLGGVYASSMRALYQGGSYVWSRPMLFRPAMLILIGVPTLKIAFTAYSFLLRFTAYNADLVDKLSYIGFYIAAGLVVTHLFWRLKLSAGR